MGSTRTRAPVPSSRDASLTSSEVPVVLWFSSSTIRSKLTSQTEMASVRMCQQIYLEMVDSTQSEKSTYLSPPRRLNEKESFKDYINSRNGYLNAIHKIKK